MHISPLLLENSVVGEDILKNVHFNFIIMRENNEKIKLKNIPLHPMKFPLSNDIKFIYDICMVKKEIES